MNYLAHAFLSLNDDEIQLGNLIGDFVKGNKYERYPPKIKKGILLHRHIDSFTDHHQVYMIVFIILNRITDYQVVFLSIFYSTIF